MVYHAPWSIGNLRVVRHHFYHSLEELMFIFISRPKHDGADDITWCIMKQSLRINRLPWGLNRLGQMDWYRSCIEYFSLSLRIEQYNILHVVHARYGILLCLHALIYGHYLQTFLGGRRYTRPLPESSPPSTACPGQGFSRSSRQNGDVLSS